MKWMSGRVLGALLVSIVAVATAVIATTSGTPGDGASGSGGGWRLGLSGWVQTVTEGAAKLVSWEGMDKRLGGTYIGDSIGQPGGTVDSCTVLLGSIPTDPLPFTIKFIDLTEGCSDDDPVGLEVTVTRTNERLEGTQEAGEPHSNCEADVVSLTTKYDMIDINVFNRKEGLDLHYNLQVDGFDLQCSDRGEPPWQECQEDTPGCTGAK